MPGLYFSVPGASIAVDATPKTVLGLKAPANHPVAFLGYELSFDGDTDTEAPALIEFGTCTFASNGPGTNSTSVTPAKTNPSMSETPQSTAAKTWVAEPTVITVFKSFTLPMYMGTGIIQFPRGLYIVKGGEGVVVRITCPATLSCNFSGTLQFEE
jgi:hypothetical protein